MILICRMSVFDKGHPAVQKLIKILSLIVFIVFIVFIVL